MVLNSQAIREVRHEGGFTFMFLRLPIPHNPSAFYDKAFFKMDTASFLLPPDATSSEA
jgi:hypothetical protein